jgi:hypothetical protein
VCRHAIASQAFDRHARAIGGIDSTRCDKPRAASASKQRRRSIDVRTRGDSRSCCHCSAAAMGDALTWIKTSVAESAHTRRHENANRHRSR